MRVRVKQMLDNRYLLLVLRLALGGIFIAASVGKIAHLDDFASLVASYNILPDSLARLYGYSAPWVEVVIGCMLFLRLFPEVASGISLALVVSFMVANIRGLLYGIEDPCGCFGGLIALGHLQSLLLDILMLLMALLILRTAIKTHREPGRRFSIIW